MELLFELGLELSRWLQTQYPQLAPLMAVVSLLGRFEFYLALLPLIYWSVNKHFGKEVAYLLALSNILNLMAKHLLRQPRPYWLDAELGLDTELSYGIPSGHVQSLTILLLLVAARARRRWVWTVTGVAIFLMALSRVYLGVHFPQDAIAGFLLALAILLGYVLWRENLHQQFANRLLGQRLLGAFLLPVVLALLYAGFLLLLGVPNAPASWVDHVPEAERASLETVVQATGILLGLGLGFILEASRVHFIVAGSILKRSLRYLLGIAVTVAIWRGLGAVFPDEPLWLGLPLRLFRYWLAGFWVAYYAPLVFLRLRLAEASPEPDVKLTVSDGGIMDR